MMYRDPTFDIEQMQRTMRQFYLDNISRNSRAKGKIAGRGVAMSAETSICSCCGKEELHARTCWKKQDEANKSNGAHDNKHFGGNTATKGAAGPKWRSVHKTTSHSDAGCYEQGVTRPEQSGAHLASAV